MKTALALKLLHKQKPKLLGGHCECFEKQAFHKVSSLDWVRVLKAFPKITIAFYGSLFELSSQVQENGYDWFRRHYTYKNCVSIITCVEV